MAKTKDEVQEEVLNVLLPVKRGGAGVSMGVGKTRLSLKHMKIINKRVITAGVRPLKALVVAPKKKVFDTWKSEAVDSGNSGLLQQIDFSTYRSLTKQSLDYDIIYMDECHNLLESHDAYLSQFTGRIIGLTGTPPKYAKSQKGKMVAKYCPIIYEYLTDDAIEDNVLNDYKIIVHLLPLSIKKDYQVKIKDKKTGEIKKQWWTSEKANYDYWTRIVADATGPQERQRSSIMRMTAMKSFPTKEVYGKKLLDQATKKAILFANTQEQADKLCQHSYHSKNPNAEANYKAFNDGTINKLSCVFQLSEGANMVMLEIGIILHAYGNNRKLAQRLGRLLRLPTGMIAEIHVLCFKDTVDVKWVTDALEGFASDKVEWYDPTIF